MTSMNELPSPTRAIAGLCLMLGASACAHTPARSTATPTPTPTPTAIDAQTPKTTRAHGTFDVALVAQPTDAKPLGRMAIEKQFYGDLEATSRGEMLSAMGGEKGSAGYVALEHVSGKLRGRKGSFVLQHSGTLTRGAQQLSVTVVPDSGTDELTGLAGSMVIIIADGQHSYDFNYTLGATP